MSVGWCSRRLALRYAELSTLIEWSHVMTKQKHHSTHPKDAAQSVESAEDRLDEALEESFPASDPIAVDVGEAHHLPVEGGHSGGKKRH